MPFPGSAAHLISEELNINLFPAKRGGVWRSISSEEEFARIEKWVRRQGHRVFLRDCLNCSIALAMNYEENNSVKKKTEVGELERQAKYEENP